MQYKIILFAFKDCNKAWLRFSSRVNVKFAAVGKIVIILRFKEKLNVIFMKKYLIQLHLNFNPANLQNTKK